jgi:hypothetical protein
MRASLTAFGVACRNSSVPLSNRRTCFEFARYGQEFYVRDPDGYVLGFVQDAASATGAERKRYVRVK